MSTQDQNGIPFVAMHEQQNLRLLELPPELLDLMSSDNPPCLTIKSGSTIGLSPSKVASSHALLCSPDRTFQLRQVSSSNSIYLLQHGLSTSGDEDSPPVPTLSAIALCKATLELHPVTPSLEIPLRRRLPVYEGSSMDGEDVRMMQSSRETPPGHPKEQIFADLPASDSECERQWVEICGFEENGLAMRPSADSLVNAWKQILETTIEYGYDFQSMPRQAMCEVATEEDCPASLIDAVLTRISPLGSSRTNPVVAVDRSRCVSWLGRILLEAMGRSRYGVATQTFLDAWSDKLPEPWRGDACLDTISGLYSQPNQKTIKLVDEDQVSGVPATKATPAVTTSSRGARKWHEKFKNTRR